MGLVLTAEFLAEAGDAVDRFGSADRLAAVAGIVPVLRASRGPYRRRARKGNRNPKRVFYRSASCALCGHGPSQEYYRRQRAEGKGA